MTSNINVIKARAINTNTTENTSVTENNATEDTHDLIKISLAYAKSTQSHEHYYLEVQVEQGTTLYQAIEQIGWLQQFAEINDWCEQVRKSELGLATKPNAREWCVGIHSQKKPLNYQLKANDRIEVYRPLTSDPMKRRKKRAKW